MSLLTNQVYEWIAGHGPPTVDQVPTGVTGVWLALTGIGVVFLAPLGEETLFRGFLYRGLRRPFTSRPQGGRAQLPVWAAAVISGGLFGLGHLQGWSFFVLSRRCGWSASAWRWSTRSAAACSRRWRRTARST